MNKEQKTWLAVLGGGGVLGLGLAWLIYSQLGSIADGRAEVEQLRNKVAAARKLIEGTNSLEREVIVQREMSEVMGTILPDNEDMNNWVRTIQGFSDTSAVRIRGLKKKNNAAGRTKKEQTAFDGRVLCEHGIHGRLAGDLVFPGDVVLDDRDVHVPCRVHATSVPASRRPGHWCLEKQRT